MKRKKVKSYHSRKKKNQQVHLIAIVLAVFLLALVGKTIIPLFNDGAILGITTFLAKGDDSGSSGSGSSGSGSSSDDDSDDSTSSGSGSSGSSNSDSSGSAGGPTKTETRDSTTGVRTTTETKEDESRTEVRLSEEERIRTRTKDGTTRIDITSGGVKTRLEYRDDRVIIKAEQEDGTEVELEDDTLFKIEQRLGASGIKVATAGAQSFLVQSGNTGALTNFPISIDLATNTLIINTPSGQRSVAVLPDQAVQNLIAANIVNRLGGQAVVDETLTNNFTSVDQLVTLGEKNGIPIYEISGISDQRLLGFIPVSLEKEIEVTADTGEVISTNVSLGDRILDLISF